MKGILGGLVIAVALIAAFVFGTQFEERNEGSVERLAEQAGETIDQAGEQLQEMANGIERQLEESDRDTQQQ